MSSFLFQAVRKLPLNLPESGSYVLVLEYAREDSDMQKMFVLLGTLPTNQELYTANIYSCAYRCVSSLNNISEQK